MAHFVIEDIYEKSDAFFADSCGFPLIYHAIFVLFCFVLFCFVFLIIIVWCLKTLYSLSRSTRNFYDFLSSTGILVIFIFNL